jgi:hypothetical protein
MQPTTKTTQQFAFGPRNYRIMGIGLAVLAAGFITMMFGDKANYGEDFVGITLGPMLLVLGFVIEFFAIMVRDKSAIMSGTVPTVVEVPSLTPVTPAPAPAAPAYKRL